MLRRLFFTFLLLTTPFLGDAKLPEITSTDVTNILHEIMEAHVTHKKLSPLIVSRALEGFIEELDPCKIYFLESEIQEWINPTEEKLQAYTGEIEEENYSIFFSIHKKMVEAIARRNRIEDRITSLPLVENVSASEFKDLTWTASEETLQERLHRLRSLQAKTIDRLKDDSKEKIFQRIAKRRQHREEEICSTDPLDHERFIFSCILKAFASSLDTHTAYFTPAEAKQFLFQVQQRLFGIGVQLRDDLDGFSVMKILEGGPATHTTIKEKDKIIAINGDPIVGMDIQDVVELIRGEEGSAVCLTVLREGEEQPLDIDITRGEVVIQDARLESSILPYADGVILHLALHSFYQDPIHSSASDLYEEISKARRDHKIKGIILDVRQNTGGVLPQAVAVTGLFITKGIVVSVKDNHGLLEHLRHLEGKTAWDGPLIVLTSKLSASAAEIVAQTLQDYGRAIVVGDACTYGKGTFQTFTLDASGVGKVNPKGEFKVTRGRYYTVSGKSPQLEGVKPDIVVGGIYSALDIGEQKNRYPVENDVIEANFQDDLADIPSFQREQISWLYRFNLQPCLKIYTQHLPTLKKNSELRLQKNDFYQGFIKFLEKDDEENPPAELLEVYNQTDLQLEESVHIMKDLISLLK